MTKRKKLFQLSVSVWLCDFVSLIKCNRYAFTHKLGPHFSITMVIQLMEEVFF